MSSAADFPVRTSVSPARELVLQGSGQDSGPTTSASLARFDPATCSWRTSQRCLVEDWTRFSETWPRSGLMRNGTAYQLPTWAPLIAATESGSWPTPHGFSQDGRSNGPSGNELGRAVNQSLLPTPTATTYGSNLGGGSGRVGKPRPSLNQMARQNLWPTPRNNTGPDLSDRHLSLDGAVRLWPTPTVHGNYNKAGASPQSGDGLATAVKFWRTPNASDADQWSNQTLEERQRKGSQVRLNTQVSPEGGAGGSLNPTWVEWLMGFPLGWTALEPSETPSSRRSRSSSAAP